MGNPGSEKGKGATYTEKTRKSTSPTETTTAWRERPTIRGDYNTDVAKNREARRHKTSGNRDTKAVETQGPTSRAEITAAERNREGATENEDPKAAGGERN